MVSRNSDITVRPDMPNVRTVVLIGSKCKDVLMDDCELACMFGALLLLIETFENIGWQAPARDPTTNKPVADPNMFPNGIKNLTDEIHNLGLKFGIYSDAGMYTCGGRFGSLDFEEIDAQTYAEWGVDYLSKSPISTK